MSLICIFRKQGFAPFQGKQEPIELEYSVHEVPKMMILECLNVFPHLKEGDSMLCIPTFQKSHADLVRERERGKRGDWISLGDMACTRT